MRAMQERQQAEMRQRAEFANMREPTIEERIEKLRDLEVNQHAHLFATSYSTIHKAAMDNSISGVTYFLDKRGGKERKIRVDDFDKFAVCAIHYAAERGHTDVIKFLLERGNKVDCKSGDECTALMYAAKENKLEAIDMLMTYGAKPWAQNRAGMTPLHFAAQGDHKDAVEFILKKYIEIKTETEKAAEEELLEGGGVASGSNKAKGNKKDKEKKGEKSEGLGGPLPKGAAPLTIEEMEMYTDMTLIEMASKNGTRPLHTACIFNSIRCIEFFISKGADITATDTIGETPLHKVARSNAFQAYRMLVQKGADERIANKARETPLDLLRDDTKYN